MADSTRTGGGYSRAPAHQNRFAYKHNKNSKITKRIYSISHHGLCERCTEQIEWRKTYRKYKALKAPAKCRGCDQKNVKRAYHTLCSSCAGGKRVCAKCVKPLSALSLEEVEARRLRQNATKVEALIENLREREKRAIRRKMALGMLKCESVDGINYELVECERPVDPDAEEGDEDLDEEDEDDSDEVDGNDESEGGATEDEKLAGSTTNQEEPKVSSTGAILAQNDTVEETSKAVSDADAPAVTDVAHVDGEEVAVAAE
jgi:hypothetical protein